MGTEPGARVAQGAEDAVVHLDRPWRFALGLLEHPEHLDRNFEGRIRKFHGLASPGLCDWLKHESLSLLLLIDRWITDGGFGPECSRKR